MKFNVKRCDNTMLWSFYVDSNCSSPAGAYAGLRNESRVYVFKKPIKAKDYH